MTIEAEDPDHLYSLEQEANLQSQPQDYYEREGVYVGSTYWRSVQEYRDTIDVEVILPMRIKDLGVGLWDSKFWIDTGLAIITTVIAVLEYRRREDRADLEKQERKLDTEG